MADIELAAKDRQLLELLSHGLDQEAVARHLGISYGAMVSRVRILRARLNANTTTHLVAVALRTKLIK